MSVIKNLKKLKRKKKIGKKKIASQGIPPRRTQSLREICSVFWRLSYVQPADQLLERGHKEHPRQLRCWVRRERD